jgi:cytochrome c peroxidase
MMFKVPSLRNVALTAPYFHDGSISDLGVAIKMMGAFQLGIDISDRDVAAIAAWLAALTGDVGAVAAPRLP